MEPTSTRPKFKKPRKGYSTCYWSIITKNQERIQKMVPNTGNRDTNVIVNFGGKRSTKEERLLWERKGKKEVLRGFGNLKRL